MGVQLPKEGWSSGRLVLQPHMEVAPSSLLPEVAPHLLLIRARGERERETEREEEKNCSKLFIDNIIMCHNSVSVMGKSECGRGWGSTVQAAQ